MAGGVCGAIVDEALLNAPSYASTRAFLREHFFIKAIISLPRNAFEFLAKTTAKTSIILLTRKPRSQVGQREPIFYAAAERIGYTSTGICKDNDLVAICKAFGDWRDGMLTAYAGPHLNMTLVSSLRLGTEAADDSILIDDCIPTGSDRLDYAWRRKERIIQTFTNPVILGDIVDCWVTPPTDLDRQPTGDFLNAYVSSVDGRVISRGEKSLKYKNRDLRRLAKDDILISSIDAVRGAIGLVTEDLEGHVVSKEFIVLRIKPAFADRILPGYIAAVLRSSRMKALLEGVTTGVSNRTRLETPDMLLTLPIENPPDLAKQLAICNRIKRAYEAQDEADRELALVADELG